MEVTDPKTKFKFVFNKKILFKIALILGVLCVLFAAFLFGVNYHVKSAYQDCLLTVGEAEKMEEVDCILVLGCGLNMDGSPSEMLADRLLTGIALYQAGVAPKLLMSGDHGQIAYDEVGVMKEFAMQHGVPSEDIFMDHAGFSTYESMYRAKEIFCTQRIVVVTQKYHLYRAEYNARELGIEAYGVASQIKLAGRQLYYESREIIARTKDYALCVFQPLPTYLGDAIPVSGNGDVTNDDQEV